MSNKPISAEDQALVDHSRKLEQLREAFEQNFKLDIWPVYQWLKNNGGFPPVQPAAGEPVAWLYDYGDGNAFLSFDRLKPDMRQGKKEVPLCAAPPAAAHGDEAVPADLKARCREIAQWRKSGVLRGDALRKYAESRWPGDPSALQMAEHETATEAFQVVSAMHAQAGEGVRCEPQTAA